ncbi:TetR/AcrR family transcriptional regulator [Streptacidiphilus fuscans]|uniref:TetR/AcrR family transcriptional regulator n=1 Tax=Streptacidiphilus fuscans TaxID=2789292 RepID=A0A931FGL4_9ACTN|nr:TetR/AcrR family transcriptional regulator [Streptacidiphilus fuscans]MBF9071405.1 TetR/AcrR family transcriptional regulator [Streptacidiphilus fuscans]
MKSSAVDSQFEQMIGREIGGRATTPARSTAPGAEPADCPAPARRGRPRTEGVEDSIVEGMLRLMARGTSLAGMTIEAIAAEAKVGKSTIYRRWPDREALLLHLLTELDAEAGPLYCERGTLRETLISVVESIRRMGVTRRSGTSLALVAAEIRAIPALYEKYSKVVIEPRREALRSLILDAQLRGELRGDLPPDLMAELIVGPMLSLTVLHPESPLRLEDSELSSTIVDAVLTGVGVKAPQEALTSTKGT